jgi:hypothetical protein
VELVARAADGLDAAHERGLVHRDVKPSNVLIASPGEHEHVYLADFGLTKTAESEAEAKDVAQLSGTTDYVAPELITEGGAGKSADIYALGCVLYEALTGEVPYPRDSELETLVAHIDAPVPKPSTARPEVSANLDAVVERAMAKDPAVRYTSAAELAGAARETLPSAGRSRRLAVLLAAVAVTLAGAALAAVLLTRDDAPGPNAPTVDLAATGAVQRVDPETGKLEATIRIPGQPLELATGSGAVWLADDGDDVVYRIEPDTYERTISRSSRGKGLYVPQTLASSGGSVWLGAGTQDGQALLVPLASSAGASHAIDLQALAQRSGDTGPPVRALTQLVPGAIASPPGMFTGWVLDAAEGVLRRVRAGTPPALSSPIETGGAPHVAAADGRTVWIGQGQELVKLLGSNVAWRRPLPGTPVALAVGAKGVWVATADGSLVLMERDGTVARTVRTQGSPVDLELAYGSLWLLQRDGTLSMLEPATGNSITSESVGSNAVALAVGLDSVWVGVRGGSQLGRSNLPSRLQGTTGFPLPAVPQPCIHFSDTWKGCRNAYGLFMAAHDGSRAGYSGYFWERRVRGSIANVKCQGKEYRGPAISDVRNAGSGLLWIEGWGTLAIHFARMVVVVDTVQRGRNDPARPLITCSEGTGTWIAIAGPLKGERGAFEFLGPPPRERIILR